MLSIELKEAELWVWLEVKIMRRAQLCRGPNQIFLQ
jgi:hypothetical protein